jgi:hypothetical protein
MFDDFIILFSFFDFKVSFKIFSEHFIMFFIGFEIIGW